MKTFKYWLNEVAGYDYEKAKANSELHKVAAHAHYEASEINDRYPGSPQANKATSDAIESSMEAYKSYGKPHLLRYLDKLKNWKEDDMRGNVHRELGYHHENHAKTALVQPPKIGENK